jgi:hypothetical protein
LLPKPPKIELNCSLSRSAAQKSQPTLDGVSAAAWQGVLQVPSEQTSSPTQLPVWTPPVPSALHSKMSLPLGPSQ